MAGSDFKFSWPLTLSPIGTVGVVVIIEESRISKLSVGTLCVGAAHS